MVKEKKGTIHSVCDKSMTWMSLMRSEHPMPAGSNLQSRLSVEGGYLIHLKWRIASAPERNAENSR